MNIEIGTENWGFCPITELGTIEIRSENLDLLDRFDNAVHHGDDNVVWVPRDPEHIIKPPKIGYPLEVALALGMSDRDAFDLAGHSEVAVPDGRLWILLQTRCSVTFHRGGSHGYTIRGDYDA